MARKRKIKSKKKYIGPHVSISGGIWNAVKSSVAIGGHAFALFLGSQSSWMRPALDTAAAVKFQEACAQHVFDTIHILPCGSYLMNCGSPKEDVFSKSQAMLVDELRHCSALGLSHFNFHPGASIDSTPEKCMEKIAQAINQAHQQTPAVITVLENMSGQGSTIGGEFSELGSIIDRVRDKTRVGVCLDTCHAFAAGKLEIVNEPRLDNIPLILDTPGFEFAEQIELLYSICEKRRRIKHLLDGSYY
uniref:Si:ch211-141o9.10 n=1 Tax=Sinocyclocheilus rhinocerous TaxID=307959 RepID=A0A673JKX9_9TELE